MSSKNKTQAQKHVGLEVVKMHDKYKVIKSNKPEEFEREVDEHLQDGWKLVGGLSMLKFGAFEHYYQAVTKLLHSSAGKPSAPLSLNP